MDAGAYPTVAPSTTYTYEVRAINNGGASPWSNPVTVRTLGVTPATPPSLSAVPVSAGEIDLAWTRGDGRETRVAIFRRADAGDWQRIGVVAPHTTRYADQTVTPGTTYTYQVRTHSNTEASAWSNEVSVTTLLINGVAYWASSPRLTATFTQSDGGVTVNSYQGLVQLHVTGVGQSYANVYNDAFYLFTNQFSTIQHGWDGGFYQLAFGTSPLPLFDVGNNAERFLVGPLPAYNSAHDYTFIVDTKLVSPGVLHFGVSDGGFSDNTGAYTITVTQLMPLR